MLDEQFPIVESQDREEVKEAQAGQINSILYLFYALLALSIIVSLFGVVNTLTLSIHERTRELGMTRAIGMSRRQVRRTVRYEAAITALIGAVLGLVLGTFFAWIVTQPLLDEGFTFELPVTTMVILLVVAALAGVVSGDPAGAPGGEGGHPASAGLRVALAGYWCGNMAATDRDRFDERKTDPRARPRRRPGGAGRSTSRSGPRGCSSPRPRSAGG